MESKKILRGLQNKMKLKKYKNLNLKIQIWQVVKVIFEIDWGGEQKGREEWLWGLFFSFFTCYYCKVYPTLIQFLYSSLGLLGVLGVCHSVVVFLLLVNCLLYNCQNALFDVMC